MKLATIRVVLISLAAAVSGVATGQIARSSPLPVVPARMRATTAAANWFFERRVSVTTLAFGSPKTPRTVGLGWKPGNAYVSQSRRFRFDVLAIQTSCTNSASVHMPQHKQWRGFQTI